MPAATSASAQEQGSVAIRLLEGPSNRSDDPRARQYVIDHLRPGDAIRRRFQLDNRTSAPVDVQLYAAAASVDDGTFHFADGRQGNELTSWITIAPPSVRLPPRGSSTASLAIDVPEGVGGGERYAVVWAELPSASSPSGVTLVNRVGIRVYLSVGGDAEPPTHFTLKTFTPVRRDDHRGVDIDACNDGGRAVDLAGSLRLAEGPGGTSAGPFESVNATTLAPGDCGPLFVAVPDDLPRGPWRARATLHSGTTEETAEATIAFPGDDSASAAARPVPAEPVTSSGLGRGLIALALLLLLLAIGMLGLRFARRRRRDQRQNGQGRGLLQ